MAAILETAAKTIANTQATNKQNSLAIPLIRRYQSPGQNLRGLKSPDGALLLCEIRYIGFIQNVIFLEDSNHHAGSVNPFTLGRFFEFGMGNNTVLNRPSTIIFGICKNFSQVEGPQYPYKKDS